MSGLFLFCGTKRKGGYYPPGRHEHPNVGADPCVRPCRHEQPNVGADPCVRPTVTNKKRRGRCPHRPINIVSANISICGRADNIRPYISQYVLQTAGRPRAASPTIRFRKRHSKGRADNIRPYISAYIVPKAGTSRTPSLQFIRAYDFQTAGRIISAPTFPHTLSQRPGRRGRRPLQFVSADAFGSAGRPRAASPTIS